MGGSHETLRKWKTQNSLFLSSLMPGWANPRMHTHRQTWALEVVAERPLVIRTPVRATAPDLYHLLGSQVGRPARACISLRCM